MSEMPPLFAAIHTRQADSLARLLAENPALIDARWDLQSRNGALRGPQRPLVHAWQLQDEDLANMLMRRGARLDIFEAAALGRAQEVRQLLDSDPQLANATRADSDRWYSPLHCACRGGHLEVARILLDHKADPNLLAPAAVLATWEKQELAPPPLPLHFRAQWGDVPLVSLLLERGADPNLRGWNETPLHFAVCQFLFEPPPTWADVVDALLAAGADINAADGPEGAYQWTALHKATWVGHADAVRGLLERGADSLRRNNFEQTPLEMAQDLRQDEDRTSIGSKARDEDLDAIIDLLRQAN